CPFALWRFGKWRKAGKRKLLVVKSIDKWSEPRRWEINRRRMFSFPKGIRNSDLLGVSFAFIGSAS
ncbi:MAG: hypothetical protein ACETV1_06920, partial [Candidatus Bathyarchaeia archaeon]